MTHTADHDPIRDHAECAVCSAALRQAFNRLADLDLGPRDTETIIRRLQDIADSHIRVIAGPYDCVDRGDFDEDR